MKLKNLGLSVLLLPLIGYYYFIHFKYAIDFPVKDEYRTICTVILDFIQAPDFWSKMKVMLVNENESLQLVLKLFNVLSFSVTGEIQYRWLAAVGQLSLLVFPFVVWQRKYALALVVLIVFNLQYYVLSFRHDTSFYYHVGLAGVLLSAYFWMKKDYKAVVLFFLLAIFNNTSSVFILPIFLLDYLLNQNTPSKRVLWMGAGAFVLVLVGFYLLNPLLFYLPEGPFITFKSLLIILGNFVDFHFGYLREKPYLFFGSLHLVFALGTFVYYMFFYKEKNDNARFYAILAMYFLLSILAIALKRSSLYHHINTLLDPRYKIFTFPALVFMFLLWTEMVRIPKWVKASVFVVLLGYNFLSAAREKDAVRYYDQALKLNSVSVPRGYDMMGPVHIDFATAIYQEMREANVAPKVAKEGQGWYDFMEAYEFSGREKVMEADIKSVRLFDSNRYHTILEVNGKDETRKSIVALKSKDHVFLFAIDYFLPQGYLKWLQSGEYCGPDFVVNLFLSVLEEGEYTLCLLSEEGKGKFSVQVHPEKVVIDARAKNMEDEFPGNHDVMD
jgi:hypothetical protein